MDGVEVRHLVRIKPRIVQCPKWTEEEKLQAISLWNDKYSASRIAQIMGNGLTRNAVIGRLDRTKKKMEKKGVITIVSRPNNEGRVYQPSAPKALKSRKYTPAPEPIVTSAVEAGEFVHIVDLSNKMCKWPVSEDAEGHVFCCRPPAPERPYCEAHCAIGYAGIPEQKRRDLKLRHSHI